MVYDIYLETIEYKAGNGRNKSIQHFKEHERKKREPDSMHFIRVIKRERKRNASLGPNQ